MLEQRIIDNRDKIRTLEYITRDYEWYDDLWNLNKIVTFVGPRRVGKTFLMFQFIHHLIAQGRITYDQVVFLDLSQFRGESLDPQAILDTYFRITPEKDPFFVFDEVQDITNFVEFILFFYTSGYKIFMSGSNSTLLSSELVTEFRGRTFQYEVFPLTFREVMRFKGIEIGHHPTSHERGKLSQILHEILLFGSYPEIVLSENTFFREALLRDYLDVLTYKDLMERYSLENEFVIRFLMKKIILSNTKTISINKIYNDLKSMNIKVGKMTLYNTLEFLENIFFFKQIKNAYTPQGAKKGFLYNLGFREVFVETRDVGKNFENFIFLHLLKKYHDIQYKLRENEIDFFIEKERLNIQVCYELHDENLIRESYFDSEDGRNILITYKNNTLTSPKETVDWYEFFINL